MADVNVELQKVVAEYGIARAWVAAHPGAAVAIALTVGVMVGWLL